MVCLFEKTFFFPCLKALVGSWFARGAVQAKVLAKLREPSAEKTPLALCLKIPLEKTTVRTPKIYALFFPLIVTIYMTSKG